MGKRKNDLPERSFWFALEIIKLCRELDKEPGVSRTISYQLVRSGTSVGANIEEGQASQSEADFLAKYSISCKEARETYFWLRLLTASKIADEYNLQPIIQECNELISILTTIVKKLKEKRS